MFHGLRVLIALAVLSWVSLGALVAVFLKIALRPDAGFGAVGQGALRRKLPPRAGMPPVAIPPRHVSRWSAAARPQGNESGSWCSRGSIPASTAAPYAPERSQASRTERPAAR